MSLTLIIQFLVLTTVVSGVLIFVLKKVLFDSTQGAVNRLNKETEEVRSKQTELNTKIKEANEELSKRQKEADALVEKMTTEAEEKARAERDDILKKARTEAEEIINKAQRTKDEIRRVLEKEMKMKAIDFTVLLLSEVLSEKPLEQFDDNFIDDFISNVEKVEMDVVDATINEAEVIVSKKLKEAHKNKLSDILQKKLNRVIKINETIDEKVITGMILKFGSLSLDGSLMTSMKDRAEEIKTKLDKGIIS